ncbi:MAG: hypothetical protein IBX53_14340 [Halomonas sp.]|uniref:hypothetical protein n=1 Tax=Halomonas sp. TaxID=1486246 RepID=UPI0019E395FC|nr:hypothetical protein [Halomonas sp.]MBE0490250.1 hypothetical protein [Halomonas sp.]
MTTERVPSLLDKPLPSTNRQVRQRSRNAARFLTLWNRPAAADRSTQRRRQNVRQA